MKITKAIIAAALISSALFTTSCGKLQEVDPFDPAYFSYEVSGISGYTGTISLPSSSGVTPEAFQENFTPSFQCDNMEKLSNGDIVKVKLAESKDYLKKNGYKATRTEMDVTISGLEELPETLPNEAVENIKSRLKDAVFQEYSDLIYPTGYEVPKWDILVASAGEMQFVRGLYEVTADQNTDAPKASFKAIWSITYKLERILQAKPVETRTDYFYSEISDFTILDGKIHYNDSVEPLLDNALLKNLDYLSNTYFENSDDKEYFVKVEY